MQGVEDERMPETGRKNETDAKANGNDDEFKVEDRRHWQADDEPAAEDVAETESDAGDAADEPAPVGSTMIDEFRQRAEAAEAKLQEYIDAYKADREEHERVRARLERDVERRVDLQFGDLATDLLTLMDDLDLALTHVAGNAEAAPLAQGVSMARDRFLSTLEKHGIRKIVPDGEEFDPNEAEALRVDPVDTPEKNGVVTETLQAGYRLGDRVIRPARVAVGRHSS
jgi:molecular chaperone GrpE